AAIFLLVFLMITGGFRSSEGAMATIVAIWFSAGIVSDLVFLAQARAGLDRGLRYWVAEALHA
ncbi:MAG: hypothetical protein NT154_20570, partial [Verrucomicrobia bacterium]|nr:hypothetical protein [Verrucomicrobiota bacterium]